MDDTLLLTLKALSDASRLRIVGLLAARPHAVEELAAAVELTPGIVVYDLRRLEAAGLVEARATHPYVEYSLRVDRLHALGRQLGELERTEERAATSPGPDGEPLPAFEAKILRAFVVDGRLASIPAQDKKKLVVLGYLRRRCFAEDRAYPETESTRCWRPSTRTWRRCAGTWWSSG